jgi:hypothetical protein
MDQWDSDQGDRGEEVDRRMGDLMTESPVGLDGQAPADAEEWVGG